jgi:hypothetical protein
MGDNRILDRDAEAKKALKRLKKMSEPQVKTGTCAHCGRDIFNRRAVARFCSAKCRVAACRKALPPPATREVERLQAENARLETLVQRLEAENARLQALVRHLPSKKERDLAAEARRAKLLRAEERAKRVLQRRKV